MASDARRELAEPIRLPCLFNIFTALPFLSEPFQFRFFCVREEEIGADLRGLEKSRFSMGLLTNLSPLREVAARPERRSGAGAAGGRAARAHVSRCALCLPKLRFRDVTSDLRGGDLE